MRIRSGTGLLWGSVLFLLCGTGAAQTPESPIVVRDGTIIIESTDEPLNTWTQVNPTQLRNPNGNKRLSNVDVSGPGTTLNSTCAGKSNCIIEARWADGKIIRLRTVSNGRGARFESNGGLTFTDPAWQKTNTVWTLPIDTTSVTITIRDGGGPATQLCSGKGCEAKTTFRQ